MSEEILEEFLLASRKERLDEVLAARTSSLTVVLDHVKNYHNVSAVLRSADAFGVSEVQLVGPTYEFSRGISLGSERWINLRKHESIDDSLNWLKQNDYEIVVLCPEDNSNSSSIPVSELPFEKKLALIFGNEADGVNKKFTNSADINAYIPMSGFVESLNISVACAITLFCSTIGKVSPKRRTAKMTESETNLLKNKWLKQSVKHSEKILREVEKRDNAK